MSGPDPEGSVNFVKDSLRGGVDTSGTIYYSMFLSFTSSTAGKSDSRCILSHGFVSGFLSLMGVITELVYGMLSTAVSMASATNWGLGRLVLGILDFDVQEDDVVSFGARIYNARFLF
jgi:hypothetical protein